MIQSSSRAWLILSPPQLQASVAPFSSASQNGWLNYFLAVFILLLLLLTNFFLLPSLLAHGFCCLPAPAASRLLGASIPINPWLLFCSFCLHCNSCCLFHSCCLADTWFQLLCGSCSLIASAASGIFKPSAASWISHDVLTHVFCFSRLLLYCGSYCFMASTSFWPIVALLLHGFC